MSNLDGYNAVFGIMEIKRLLYYIQDYCVASQISYKKSSINTDFHHICNTQ